MEMPRILVPEFYIGLYVRIAKARSAHMLCDVLVDVLYGAYCHRFHELINGFLTGDQGMVNKVTSTRRDLWAQRTRMGLISWLPDNRLYVYVPAETDTPKDR